MKAFVPYLWHFSFIGSHLLTTQSFGFFMIEKTDPILNKMYIKLEFA